MKKVVERILIVLLVVCLGFLAFTYLRIKVTPLGIRYAKSLLDVDLEGYIDDVLYLNVEKAYDKEDFIIIKYSIQEGKEEELKKVLDSKIPMTVSLKDVWSSESVREAAELLGVSDVEGFDYINSKMIEGKVNKTREIGVYISGEKLLIMG